MTKTITRILAAVMLCSVFITGCGVAFATEDIETIIKTNFTETLKEKIDELDADEIFYGLETDDVWADVDIGIEIALDKDFKEIIGTIRQLGDNEDPDNQHNICRTKFGDLRFSDITGPMMKSRKADRLYARVSGLMICAHLAEPIVIKLDGGNTSGIELGGKEWHAAEAAWNSPSTEKATKSITLHMIPEGKQKVCPETAAMNLDGRTYEGSTYLNFSLNYNGYNRADFVFGGFPTGYEADWDTVSFEICSLLYVEDPFVLELIGS